MTFKQWVRDLFGSESRAARASHHGKSRLPWGQQRSRCFKPIMERLEERTLLTGTPGAPAATVSTDRPDYAPGSTAVIGGSGFAAGETVTLQVLHIDGRPNTDASHTPWTVTADASGNFQTTWTVDDVDAVQSKLEVTAVGQSSHTTADAIFTDSTSPPVPRPFWVIAHNPDTVEVTAQYLQMGVNGLEPDIEYFSASDISLCAAALEQNNEGRELLGLPPLPTPQPGFYVAHGNFKPEEVLIGSKYELPLLPLTDYVTWLSGYLAAGQTQLSSIIWDVKTAAAQGPDAIGTILSVIANDLLTDHPEIRSIVNVGSQDDATSLFTSKADDLFAALPKIAGVSYPQSIGFSIDGENDVTATLPKLHTLLGDDVAFGFGDGSAGCCNSVFDIPGVVNGFLAPNTPDAIARGAFERTAFGDLNIVSYAFSMHGIDSMKMMIDQGVDGLIPADNVDPTGNLALAGITSSTSEFGDTDDALAIVNSHYDNVYLATTADDPFSVPGATTNGVGATATATVDTANDATKGQVTAVTITDGGFHYTTAPTVIFSGGGGIGATGTATIDAAGHVTGVTINNHGSGYTSAPAVALNSVVAVTGSRQGYALEVKTSDVLGGGTDAHVTFTLHGANGSASITLDTSWSKMMERNDTNYVFIPSADLGALSSITVFEDGSGGKWGIGLNSEWNLDWIKVRSFAYTGGNAEDFYLGDYGGQDIGNPICLGIICFDKGDQNPSTRNLALGAYLSATSQATATGGVEGTTAATLADATFNDRNLANTSFTVTAVDWGDTSTDATGLTISGSNGSFTVNGSHTYAEEGNYAFSITIKAGGAGPDANQTATIRGELDIADPAVLLTKGAFAAAEGTLSPVQTLATFTDPGGAEPLADYTVDVDWGNGTFVSDANVSIGAPVGGVFTVTGKHLYIDEDGFPGPVQVRITHEPGRLSEDGAPAEVVSAVSVPLTLIDPPLIAAGTSFTIVRGADPILPVATFTDPGGAEPSLIGAGPLNNDYTASIHWGDGSPDDAGVITYSGIPLDDSPTNTFTVSNHHDYTTNGTYTITVTIHHEGAVPDAKVTTTVTVVSLLNHGQGFGDTNSLVIGAVLSGGTIRVVPVGKQTGALTDTVKVLINGKVQINSDTGGTTFSGFNTITIYGQAGNDDMEVAGSVKKSAALFGSGGNDRMNGGAGNDTIFGDAGNDFINGGLGNDLIFGGDGSDVIDGDLGNDHIYGQAGNNTIIGGLGKNILVGGDGNDKIIARLGRNIMIGGNGSDKLYGNAGDDILIAGSTAYDEDDVALQAILDEWASGDRYSDRVSFVRSGGGANGVFTLDDSTVFDDGAVDTLIGDRGRDWFWVGVGDKIKDRAKNEIVNQL
jgi:Ca2+-binding RTX toxin-like protein